MPALALPALLAVIAALMALLVIYGAKPLSAFLANLFAGAPVIGGWVARNIRLAADAAVAAAESFLDRYIAPLARVITYPLFVIQSLYDAVIYAVAHAVQAMLNMALVTLPRLALTLTRAILRYYQAAVTLAVRYVDAAVTALTRAIALVAHNAQAAISALTRWTAAQLARLAGDVAHLGVYVAAQVVRLEQYAQTLAARALADATAYATSLYRAALAAVAAAESRLVAAISAVEARTLAAAARFAADAEAAAVKAVDVEAAAVAAVAWPGIIDAADALERILATDLPDIGAAVRAIPRDIPADLAGVLAGVEAISLPMLRYLERCGIPNCRNLSGLGRDLAALFGVVEDAAFLALIAALIADPEGMATETLDTLGGLAQGTVNGARHLLGVG